MANLNFDKILLGGRLTRDPEQKCTKNGDVYVCFSIAVNHKKRDGQSTSFIECDAFDETAHFIREHFQKGNAIFIVGELHVHIITDAAGKKSRSVYVAVDEAHFVESKADREETGGSMTEAIAEDSISDEVRDEALV